MTFGWLGSGLEIVMFLRYPSACVNTTTITVAHQMHPQRSLTNATCGVNTPSSLAKSSLAKLYLKFYLLKLFPPQSSILKLSLENDDKFIRVSEDDFDAKIEDGSRVPPGQKKALKKDRAPRKDKALEKDTIVLKQILNSNSGNKLVGGGYIYVDDAKPPPLELTQMWRTIE
ncbi:hypothetical protein H1R20_g6576, partial [Candolleomyces eurysporus]